MNSFRLYPSEESDTEPDLEETGAAEFQIIMQKMEQMELELQTVKTIARIKAMLEQRKKKDETQEYHRTTK